MKDLSKPVIGVIGNAFRIEDRFSTQMAGENNMRAVYDVLGALPLIFAGNPELTNVDDLLDAVDGILLTGARANVHPRHFGAEPDERYEPFDEARDAVALPLVKACAERGLPLFGICRGFQEIAVAGGCTLHPEIRDLPGRMNHRMPRLETGEIHPDPDVVFADRHEVQFREGSIFTEIFGRDNIRVNSLHGQGILDVGKDISVEGVAEDGTIEAISYKDAKGFVLGVQWHAEYDPQTNPVNSAIFKAFGKSVYNYKDMKVKF